MWHNGGMDKKENMPAVGELLKEKNVFLKSKSKQFSEGFTIAPNRILRNKTLTPYAKLAYTVLLSYAWEKNYCFPSQEKLAEDIGIAKRSVVKVIQELRQKKMIEVKKRGLGKPNIYYILDK